MTLTKPQWTHLYKEITVLAQRMTFTKVPSLQYNARDRAQEAVQTAFLRYLEQKPAGLDTLDAVRDYLAGAVRSALAHAKERAKVRKETEKAAVTDHVTVTGRSKPSAETMNLEAAQREADETRAARQVRMLKRKLRKADDTLALGTIQCIADGHLSPRDQARILECSIDEVYNARKRRKRAMEEVLAEYSDQSNDEENE